MGQEGAKGSIGGSWCRHEGGVSTDGRDTVALGEPENQGGRPRPAGDRPQGRSLEGPVSRSSHHVIRSIVPTPNAWRYLAPL